MSETMTVRIIARVRSDFGSKFAYRARAGWLTASRRAWCSSPNTAIPTRFAGWKDSAICG